MFFTAPLSVLSQGRNNNLDLIRFSAAILVIFSHAFSLTGNTDVLSYISGGGLTLGGFAVAIFFLYSGFLIAKSMERIKKGIPFFRARCLRIFPPLWFVVIISAFIIGPICTALSTSEYFADGLTYKYLLNGALFMNHELPGVFLNAPYDPTVNGALWTLPVEFCGYIACFIIFKLGFFKKKRILWFIPLFAIANIVLYVPGIFAESTSEFLITVLRPMTFFYMGVIIYVFREKIRLSLLLSLILTAGIVLSIPFGLLPLTFMLFAPYILFSIAFAAKRPMANFGRYGDFSYGIYLWAYPVQQIAAIFLGCTDPISNFAVAAAMSIGLGVITHYAIEKPLMNFK